MTDDGIWTFLSYAHDDDLPTGGGAEEEGFVTFLHRMLELKLKDLGARKTRIWRDRKRFSRGDAYDVEIEDALTKAALLIVVMSKNWLSRPYCRKELDDFICMRRASVANVEERIIVVCKRFLRKNDRPAPLNLQMGFEFYERDDQDEVSGERSFFNLGKVADDRFFEVRDDLATLLQKRSELIDAGGGTGTTLTPEAKIAVVNGRTVYLAKPAADMDQEYERLSNELQARGFSVVPDVSCGIPSAGARTYVDEALKKAELSIHLLGEKRGFVPDDGDSAEPIVRLQLMRAREAAAGTSATRDDAGFRRIVWAPKVLGSGATAERDPIKTLASFDLQHPADVVVGDVLNRFIEFLFQRLAEMPRQVGGPPASTAEDLEFFLDFDPTCDEEYGLSLASELSNWPASFIPVAGESTPDALNFNRDQLAKCDGVLLCWSQTSEVWVRSEADRLYNWQDLGRGQRFAHCRLIVGPPLTLRKTLTLRNNLSPSILFRKNQFDKVVFVDAAKGNQPSSENKGPSHPEVLIDLLPAANIAPTAGVTPI